MVGVELVWPSMSSSGINGGLMREPPNLPMSTKSMSKVSALSTRLSISGWGKDDPEVSMTGMCLKMLEGHLVWRLALHQLVMASDHHEFVEQCLEWRDFLPC